MTEEQQEIVIDIIHERRDKEAVVNSFCDVWREIAQRFIVFE